MTAHILYEDTDPSLPATVSRSIISDLLRNKLGFDGVVITDIIEMKTLLSINGSQNRAPQFCGWS